MVNFQWSIIVSVTGQEIICSVLEKSRNYFLLLDQDHPPKTIIFKIFSPLNFRPGKEESDMLDKYFFKLVSSRPIGDTKN